MKVIETFGNVLAQSMENHVNDGSIGGRIGFEQAYMATAREEIGKSSGHIAFLQKWKFLVAEIKACENTRHHTSRASLSYELHVETSGQQPIV